MNFNNFQNQDIQIDIDGDTLQNTHEATFLGIIINPKLTWKEQLVKVCTKINRFAFALYKLTKIANISTALTAYYAYVESVLRYGLLIWGNGTDINSVFIAQKRCIRSICNIASDVSCKPYFKMLKILPLPCLYILEVGIFVSQNKHLFITAKQHTQRNIRHRNNLIVNMAPNTNRCIKNCYMMCIKIYNKIPDHIKLLPIQKFKSSLRALLIENTFYSVSDFLKFKM